MRREALALAPAVCLVIPDKFVVTAAFLSEPKMGDRLIRSGLAAATFGILLVANLLARAVARAVPRPSARD